jgi:hypothetical protein
MPSDKDQTVRDTDSQSESPRREDDEYDKPPEEWKDPSKPRIKLSKAEWIGVATLIAVFVQSLFNYWTLKEIEKTTKATEVQADATRDQLPLMRDSIGAARKAIEQNNDLIDATRKQSEASLTQAEVSKRMAEQNESLIKSAKVQAETSRVSAEAARLSAEVTKEATRPLPTIEISLPRLTDDEMTITNKITNAGGSATTITFQYCLMQSNAPIIPSLRNYDPTKITVKGPSPVGAHGSHSIHVRVLPEVVKAARARRVYFYLLSDVVYQDFGVTKILTTCWVYREDFKAMGDCGDLREPANQYPINKNPN